MFMSHELLSNMPLLFFADVTAFGVPFSISVFITSTSCLASFADALGARHALHSHEREGTRWRALKACAWEATSCLACESIWFLRLLGNVLLLCFCWRDSFFCSWAARRRLTLQTSEKIRLLRNHITPIWRFQNSESNNMKEDVLFAFSLEQPSLKHNTVPFF